MTVDELIAAGFTVCGGRIDRQNVNYGRLTEAGPVLTPEGTALAASLAKPAPVRRKKAVADTTAEVGEAT